MVSHLMVLVVTGQSSNSTSGQSSSGTGDKQILVTLSSENGQSQPSMATNEAYV